MVPTFDLPPVPGVPRQMLQEQKDCVIVYQMNNSNNSLYTLQGDGLLSTAVEQEPGAFDVRMQSAPVK